MNIMNSQQQDQHQQEIDGNEPDVRTQFQRRCDEMERETRKRRAVEQQRQWRENHVFREARRARAAAQQTNWRRNQSVHDNARNDEMMELSTQQAGAGGHDHTSNVRMEVDRDDIMMVSQEPEADTTHAQSDTIANEPVQHICNTCGKSFARKDNFNKHTQLHNDPDRHECKICHYPFVRSEALLRHTYLAHDNHIHTNESSSKKQKIDNFNIRKTDEKHMHKFNTTIQTYEVTFPDNDDAANIGDVLGTLSDVFDDLIEEVTNGSAPGDRLQIALETVDLDFPIVLPFKRCDDISAEDVLAQIEKVLQSNEHFRLDSSVSVRVIKVSIPVGGRPRKGYVNLSKRLSKCRSFINIKNKDNICCARALVTAMARVDEHPQWDNIRRGLGVQTKLARNLHERAGVPEGVCGLPEIARFQNVLPEHQIVVVSQTHFDGIIFKGPETDKPVYIYLADGHYSVITSMPAFINRSYYCTKCDKGYDLKEAHACNNTCRCCFKIHNDNGPWKYCEACNRYFMGETCYDLHSRQNNAGNSTCRIFFRCNDCGKVTRRSRKEKKAHRCGERLCLNCDDYVMKDHLCYMKPTQQKKKVSQQMDDSEDREVNQDLGELGIIGALGEGNVENRDDENANPKKYVFYDFEAMQETGTHVPNLCVAHVVCEVCIEEEVDDCEVCGIREHIFEGVDCATKFCEWLFDIGNKGATAIAHNFKGYDSYFILDYLHKNAVLPTVIMTGSKVMMLEVAQCDIKLIDSLNFLPMALSKLPKTFGITELKKGYFPHFFNTSENQNAVLSNLPDVRFYNPDGMNPEERKSFLQWYDIHKSDHFDMKEELLSYCKSDVYILRRCCTKFRNLFMSLTTIDPFLYCSTIASACNLVFRSKFLKPETIGLIPTHGYKPEQTQSIEALQWMKYIAHRRQINIQHSRNGGERRIGPYMVDGIYTNDEGNEVVMEYNGCYFHGCPICYKPDTENTVNGKNMSELYQRTMDKKTFIVNQGFVYEEMWSCQWKREISENDDIKNFIDQCDIVLPLKPRDAFFGGRTETFKMYKEASQGERIRYCDFTSLYPYVNKYSSYPLKHPEIITENFSAIDSYNGLMKCTILPPRGLYLPVLPCRINNKLLFPLCRLCAQTHNETCEHSESERALTGTWVTNEIQLALEKGYKLITIHEVWHFSEKTQYDPQTRTGGLFTTYINTFLKIKQEASGWPSWVNTEADKEEYIRTYEEKEGIVLDESNITVNAGLRTIAKLMLNSFWGKFGQRPNLTQTEYISTPQRYYELLSKPNVVVHNVRFVNEEYTEVSWTADDDFVQPSDKTNAVIAAFTTSSARIKLYHLLDSLGDRVLYADTDSAIYVVKDGENEPAYGDFLGELTDELGGDFITVFASGGPKNYAYKTSLPDKDGNITHTKVRGITLNYKNKLVVNFDTVSDMARGIGPTDVTVTNEHKITRDRSKTNIVTKREEKRYRVVFDKRVIRDDYDTLPYGF